MKTSAPADNGKPKGEGEGRPCKKPTAGLSRQNKTAGATKDVTPAGFFAYGRRRETKFPTKFFAKLSFKKACKKAGNLRGR